MYAVILAGGGGTRLWPRSRQGHPKQFVDITGAGRSMIQATADRLAPLVNNEAIYVVTGAQFAEVTSSQLPQLASEQILVEPGGRNSAPAIGLACIHLYRRNPEAIAAFLPADHTIPNKKCFLAALGQAAAIAAQDYLVTLGVTPTFAHTGYGYIKSGPPLSGNHQHPLPAYDVERFLEKPDGPTAERFLSEGGYFWNAGIFISRVDRMLGEIERQLPEVHGRLMEILDAMNSSHAQQTLEQAWQSMPNISIDIGVMENAERVAMVPLDAGWNDVGSWDALEAIIEKDRDGNVVAKGDVIAIDSKHNIVYSDRHLVALIDVDDLVIVEANNALLIGHKAKMQKVKEVVETLRNQGRTDLL
jgi:mannose-1-phosphate guanylyltransferase/mannose-6-phosphate isomerase